MQENSKEHEKTIQPRKTKPKISQTRSKTHLGYWENVIFQRRPDGNWHVQIGHAGRQRKFSLGTPVKSAAAARARDLYLALVGKGWDTALAELRPERVPISRDTIGDFLDELRAVADIKPKTFKDYSVALRKIVSDAFEIDSSGKHDHRGDADGYRRWLERVHAIRLADLTPARVQAWKLGYIQRAGDDPIRLRSARISVNSFLRRSKSLFSPDLTRHLAHVPPSPFLNVRFEKRQDTRYYSTIDVEKLTRAAAQELALADPPSFLAFMLALGCGLRRMEIDRLEWSAIRFDENVIRIQPTKYLDLKTEFSIGDVPVDAELMEVFRGYHAKSSANFVIDSGNLPRKRNEGYRCQKVFEHLSTWLRAKGVVSRTPIHTLRKEAGSQINRAHGLTAASSFLRHGNITVTAAHYADHARRATTGLGGLLAATMDDKIVELQQESSQLNQLRQRQGK